VEVDSLATTEREVTPSFKNGKVRGDVSPGKNSDRRIVFQERGPMSWKDMSLDMT